MSALYDAEYARRYRGRDEELEGVGSYHALVRWVGEVCDRFDHPIDVLDLGCGTGRYFWGLRNVNTLTGLDASEPMLAEAAQPTRAGEISARHITLIKGDLATHQFAGGSFDLVYSIGVLAEHVALTRSLVTRVAGWLKPERPLCLHHHRSAITGCADHLAAPRGHRDVAARARARSATASITG